MTSRLRWQPWALPVLFGSELHAVQPWPDIYAGIAAFVQEVERLHRDALCAGGDADASPLVAEATARLRAFEIAPAAAPAATMRVVLMGRTMAGKSTLLAALTGRHDTRIGDGSQRYSRDVCAAPVDGLDDVEVVDTPGVGAHDGQEDFDKAVAEAASADLVLWVASNDSFQEETAKALRLLAGMGKPILVALNCLKSLSDDLAMEDFLDDPDAIFAQQEGNFRRIRSHLAAAGVEAVAEIPLHAQAALLAARGGGAELREASRVAGLLDALTAEQADHRDARRVIRLVDGSRRTAGALTELLQSLAGATAIAAHTSRSVHAYLENRVSGEVDRTREAVTSSVVRRVARQRAWHTALTEFGPEVERQWHQVMEDLIAELDADLHQEFSLLAKRIENVAAATEAEWRALPREYFSMTGLADFGGVWWNRAGKAVVGLGAAGAAVVAGFVFWPAALVIGLASPLAVKPLKGLVDKLFRSKAETLAKRRAQVASQTGPLLDELTETYQAAVTARIEQIERQLAPHFKGQEDEATFADMVAGRWRAAANELEELVEALDYRTTVALLRLTGRERLADSLLRVSRSPGAAVLAEFQPEQHAEAWLFPPPMPEPFATAGPQMAGAEAAQAQIFLLGLTEAPVIVNRIDAATADLSIDAPIPGGLLETWATTLAHHTNRHIRLTSTSTGARP